MVLKLLKSLWNWSLGNITLKNIKAVASTGVNRISGSITHSAPAIDFVRNLIYEFR